MAKAYERFEVPKELAARILQAVEMAKNSGKVRRGVNETTKAVERGLAQLVVIAGDVEPGEIVMHLPVLCEEKKIPYCYVPSKVELGRSSGIAVGASSVAIVEPGEGKDLLKEIFEELEKLRK